MTPQAREQAILDLVQLFEERPHLPTDVMVSQYFRQRRYIGANDKRLLVEDFYSIVRTWGTLSWGWQQIASYRQEHLKKPRALTLVHRIRQGHTLSSLVTLYDGAMYSPSPLSEGEKYMIKAVETPAWWSQIPAPLAQGIPPWMSPLLQDRFGIHYLEAIQAMIQQAPLDMRINSLKTTRQKILKKLARVGVQATLTPYAPHGLRIPGRISRAVFDSLGTGALEVQDEASQLAALFVDSKPGHMVLDLCAGAGGKTLALAALMENKGQLHAADLDEKRLQKAKTRVRHAGFSNVVYHLLDATGNAWIKRQKDRFDRVLVDAPCSGSGTWRRNPDLIWKSSPQGVSELAAIQHQLLERAAPLVKKGGRLIYATCSLFSEENDDQITAFLHRHPEFQVVEAASVWTALQEDIPYPFSDPRFFKVSPYESQMDGFFTAILERG